MIAFKLATLAFMALSTIVQVKSSQVQNLQCSSEQHRPRFHFSPQANWLNDPNGMVWYDGIYHLFYQYHPYSTIWGPMHWGHATSSDMVTWEELPIALYPDEYGEIFSGSCVVDFKNTTGLQPPQNPDPPIVAIYTSADGPTQRQSVAYSLDKAMTFQKYDKNPVLADPTRPDFRDPKVIYHEESGKWIMALAVGDKIEFFSSSNLTSWTLESEFGSDPPEGGHGGVWECPDLLPFNFKGKKLWVLLVSINPGSPNGGSGTQYFIGDFIQNENGAWAFSTYPWTSNAQWLDFGFDDYAGVTFSNEPQGRHIYMGWMNNWIYANNLPTNSWRGQMTLPRQMNIVALNPTNIRDPKYRLTSTPIPELESLRNPDQHLEILESFDVPAQTVISLTDQANFSSPLLELELLLEIQGNFGPQFSICAYNSLNEETCLVYNGTRNYPYYWYINRFNSGNVDFDSEYYGHAIAVAPRELIYNQIDIHLFLDVSSLEVFVDGGLTTLTSLHYPTEPFTNIYINHWSLPEYNAGVKVVKANLWGLRCWFENKV